MDKLLRKLEQEYIGKYDWQLRYILQEYSIEDIVNHIMEWLKIEWTENDNIDYADITTIARDFYIGSNLTEKEKDEYYKELKKQGFFIALDTNLYSGDFSKCSWAIYTFGKFGDIENVTYLESAYEKFYAETNPILSQSCLNELSFLGSKKVETYLTKLHNDNDIISKLTLLMFWNCYCESEETGKLLSDKELIKFIAPHSENVSKDEIILDRLDDFERYIFKLHSENNKISMTRNEFNETAKNYFETLELK